MLIQNCFDPIVDKTTKIIILGTLPGPESLRTRQYYKNPRNSFWKIVYALYGETPVEEYPARCEFLLKHNIGIWDVLKCAKRDGYADTNIHNAEPNDFNLFFKMHPNIVGIIFNGKEAEEQFAHYFSELYRTVRHERVLSSSGALTKPFNVKLENWRSAINKLEV